MVREIDTPIGRIFIRAEGGSVSEISLQRNVPEAAKFVKEETGKHAAERADEEVLERAARELEEYFRGERRAFDVPIETKGTPFEEKVWKALREIPYGETRSYGEIAGRIGSPKGARAVGGACGRNPVLIMTPCHRVVGSKGNLTGFTGGLDIKEKLLKLEGV